MTHLDWQQQIPFYISQSLSKEEKAAFEAHLAECNACQRELAEWRNIASAVWSQAEDAAHQLPPLSQEVYNRLQYRDRPPASRYSANPPRPRPQPGQVPANYTQASRRRFSLPLTAAAGFLVFFLFGGLLILASRPQDQRGLEVAAQLTQRSDTITQSITEAAASDTPRLSEMGLIEQPTLPPTNTVLPSVTPFPTSIPPATIAPYLLPPTATPLPPPENDDVSAITGIGGGVGGGAGGAGDDDNFDVPLNDECYVRSQEDVSVYEYDTRDAAIVGTLQAGNEYRTLVRSLRGWYQVTLPESFIRGWVTAQDVALLGNCGDLWLPTATPNLTATPESFVAESGRSQVVVMMPAQVYIQPRSDSFVVQSVSVSEVLPVLGRTTRPETWYLVELRNGSSAWINGSVVEEHSAMPTPTVFVEPTPGGIEINPMNE